MAKQDLRSQLHQAAQQLRDPFRLRLVVAAAAVLLSYVAIYSPLHSRIEKLRWELREEERRSQLAEEVDLLRARFASLEGRLHAESDVNAWIQYVLDGVRRQPLKLVNLDVEEERKLGPYRTLVMRVHVAGEMKDLDQLLQWLESNERLFRIDTLSLEPDRSQAQHCVLQMTLLALKA
jgi:Tfp pilus assembly protein PilO